MSMKLYYNEMSPPSRAVLLTAKLLGIEFDMKKVKIYSKEPADTELLQLNPQHTVPTLVDGDFILWDSHAIIAYLVRHYAKNDDLYPNDPKKKALVDQFLYFDSGVIYPRTNTVIDLIVVENENEIQTTELSAITETYKFLDTFLKNKTYLIGDCLTIADLCCVATISTATIIIPISMERYPNLSTWYRTCKNLPYYEEANGIGLNQLDALVELKLGRRPNKEYCE